MAVGVGAGRSPGTWPSCSPGTHRVARAWQAELWRRLRVAVDHPGPAEQLAAATKELRRRPEASELPGRISVFGATRLGPDSLAVLTALSAHRDVHLWLPHPSPALWTK